MRSRHFKAPKRDFQRDEFCSFDDTGALVLKTAIKILNIYVSGRPVGHNKLLGWAVSLTQKLVMVACGLVFGLGSSGEMAQFYDL